MKNAIKNIITISTLAIGLSFTTGCDNSSRSTTIIVGASPSPHADILEVARPAIEAAGYTLEIVEYDDYVQPNIALDDGSLDANYFQHLPYLNNFNEENDTALSKAFSVHFEPLGIYSEKVTSLDDISSGSTVCIPNDASNGARALRLLEAQGLITLQSGLTAVTDITVDKIISNPKNLVISELVAEQIPVQLADSTVSIGVINGNYALAAQVTDHLVANAIEDKDSDLAALYSNIVAVKTGNENNEKTTVLRNALLSDAVKTYITNTYNGIVVASF